MKTSSVLLVAVLSSCTSSAPSSIAKAPTSRTEADRAADLANAMMSGSGSVVSRAEAEHVVGVLNAFNARATHPHDDMDPTQLSSPSIADGRGGTFRLHSDYVCSPWVGCAWWATITNG